MNKAGSNEAQCFAACIADPLCMIFNHDALSGDCHMYSADCACILSTT